MQTYQHFEALNLFLELCQIPHASKYAEPLKEWIIRYAQKSGAKVEWDSVGNIHCVKGEPKLCLQGHYDMVYVSNHKDFSVKPQFVNENGQTYLCAEDSSLGADNGVAVACMLLALRDCKHLECLFTSDEEIGMVGARGIDVELQADFMLNCDSEEIDEVVCSCAGGYDLECKIDLPLLELPTHCVFYQLESQGFKGGHSGIEIHKGIPNAILECAKIAKDLVDNGALIIEFSGGEKRNSIPVGATLKIAIPKDKLQACQRILENVQCCVVKNAENAQKYCDVTLLLEAILTLQNGVIESRGEEVILSSNLGILLQTTLQNKSRFHLVAMGRGNEEALMQAHLQKEKQAMQNFRFDVEVLEYYSPWEREESLLLKRVWEVYKEFRKNPQLKTIHAGLECGILKQKYPHIGFVSIGPTILSPHSIRERLDVESFVCFDGILKEILKRFNAI